MSILDIIVQLLSKPAILVGIIALVGLIAQKKPFEHVVSGTLKTVIGFIILGGGAGIVIGAITPLGTLLQDGFNLQGALPVNEVFVALAQQKLGQSISIVFALAFIVNLLIARFTPWKYIFLTGHHILFMATLTVGMLGLTVLQGNQTVLIIVASLVTGFSMVFFPALSAPFMEKIIGSKDFVMGHFGTTTYALSGWLGRFVGDPKDSTENIKFPGWIGFMREPLIAMGVVMWIIYIIASIAGLAAVGSDQVATIFGSTDVWWLSSFIQALTFAGGIGVILLGVRMILADIVPAFRGFAEKIVPEARPALDCPTVFPYAQNAVLLGYIASIVGGLVALVIQIATGGGSGAGLVGAVILPSMIIHFFVGGTAGVFGNATGGWKGAALGGFLNGLIFTLLAGTAYVALGQLGFSNSTFGDTDFGVIGNLLAFLGSILK
ncbi:MAG: PTS ascorbate transporter subunit IIC [Anaerolineales bacterium]|jgi:PTS system ascorbate-specific IIC component